MNWSFLLLVDFYMFFFYFLFLLSKKKSTDVSAIWSVNLKECVNRARDAWDRVLLSSVFFHCVAAIYFRIQYPIGINAFIPFFHLEYITSWHSYGIQLTIFTFLLAARNIYHKGVTELISENVWLHLNIFEFGKLIFGIWQDDFADNNPSLEFVLLSFPETVRLTNRL